jgi:hypothetical protein
MADMINNTDDRAEQKLTAEQVENDCPARLQHIGKEITERLAKADKQARLAQDHLIAIERLLAEARELCDGAGFEKFRELFCPQLGKSQAYAMRAILEGRKTLAEHRDDERQRKQRTRAKQRAAAINSGTVPEKPDQSPQAYETPTTVGKVEATSTAPEQPLSPVPLRGAIHLKDDPLVNFSAVVLELLRRVDKRDAGNFAGTSVPADQLAKLGKFFTDLASLKKSRAKGASNSNATTPAEQSAGVTAKPQGH